MATCFGLSLDNLQANLHTYKVRTDCIIYILRWPEDGLRKTETCCHNKISIS